MIRVAKRHVSVWLTLLLLLPLFAVFQGSTPTAQAIAQADQNQFNTNHPENSIRFTEDPPGQCDEGINAVPPRPRQVNLVIDDSGSMFTDGENSLDRWSSAKYSLEVFAAMLGSDDQLNVYRMSDFHDSKEAGPLATVTGKQPASERVAQIHGMQLQGGATPYAPVVTAMADLERSKAPDKWLVILSDGEFNDRATADVSSDFSRFVANASSHDTRVRVAFLAIGDEAPKLESDPANGIFFEQAHTASDLLEKMASFSNRIFARSLLQQSSPGQINPDIDLEEVLVFAQGAKVTMGDLTSGGNRISSTTEVEVQWADNIDAMSGGMKVKAVPNKDLRGKLATYENVPIGTSAINIEGAQTVDVFYTPRIAFGIELRDVSGNRVETAKAVGGEYTVLYGFMDKNCNFIDSELLGEVSYTAQVFHEGEEIAKNFAPGDALMLERGDVRFQVGATYLNGNTSEAIIDLHVLQPARPTMFEVNEQEFLTSQLLEYESPRDAIEVKYLIDNDGNPEAFTEEEWASFTRDSLAVSSTRGGITFDVSLGDEPGQFFVLPQISNGDIYTAPTGEIPIMIEASHIFDEQLSEAQHTSSFTIVDDLSFLDRALHWFFTQGWKWLLALILLIILLGYVFRKRLPKQLKARPEITFKPKRMSGKREQNDGKVTKNRLRMLVPYLSETAEIRYAPSGSGAGAPMKVRAAGKGRLTLLNWKALASRGNLTIDGEKLGKDATRPPLLRSSSTIISATNDGQYTTNLNSMRERK